MAAASSVSLPRWEKDQLRSRLFIKYSRNREQIEPIGEDYAKDLESLSSDCTKLVADKVFTANMKSTDSSASKKPLNLLSNFEKSQEMKV